MYRIISWSVFTSSPYSLPPLLRRMLSAVEVVVVISAVAVAPFDAQLCKEDSSVVHRVLLPPVNRSSPVLAGGGWRTTANTDSLILRI